MGTSKQPLTLGAFMHYQFTPEWEPNTHPWIIHARSVRSGIPKNPPIKKGGIVSLYPADCFLYSSDGSVNQSVSVRVTRFDEASQRFVGIICWRPRSLADDDSFRLNREVPFEKKHIHSAY